MGCYWKESGEKNRHLEISCYATAQGKMKLKNQQKGEKNQEALIKWQLQETHLWHVYSKEHFDIVPGLFFRLGCTLRTGLRLQAGIWAALHKKGVDTLEMLQYQSKLLWLCQVVFYCVRAHSAHSWLEMWSNDLSKHSQYGNTVAKNHEPLIQEKW